MTSMLQFDYPTRLAGSKCVVLGKGAAQETGPTDAPELMFAGASYHDVESSLRLDIIEAR